MAKTSAGLLMYRRILDTARMTKKIEVFLVHPGGPFFKNNDKVWSIPKGLCEKNENLLDCAKREFTEETSFARRALANVNFVNIGFVEYSNKKVYCWAFKNDLPKDFVFKSNLSKFRWPENDKGEFFDLETAKIKMLPAQHPLLLRLHQDLEEYPTL